eukprot:TRINITY_DN20253_c0_g1_i1.p1 TRINITY_DN20253_c0_g1~~TRINITY_DN20253_c0_g1_i1.p1  ORF type:complete len:421 (-),score=37.97 TRINITY_DN20253_c0_g1_i1:22-1284(-)
MVDLARAGLLLCLALPGVSAYACSPRYGFAWYDEHAHLHNYIVSIGHIQRKTRDYYLFDKRPPLMEAWFLIRLSEDKQRKLINGCPQPMILAYLLVAEAKLLMDDDAGMYSLMASTISENLPDSIKPFVHNPISSKAWPIQEAIERFGRTARTMPIKRERNTLEVVVVHCRETLEWLHEKLLPITPAGSALTFYEKCGEQPAIPDVMKTRFSSISILPCSDPQSGPRGDPCLGYLAHLTTRYTQLAAFTVFLRGDPHEHLHFSFLQVPLKMIERGTYSVPFLQLNNIRHAQTWTPCLNAVHEAIFGDKLEPVGPFCCSQFIVRDTTVRARPLRFYKNMLRLVNGSTKTRFCSTERENRSTHCYGMEFMWHLVFGEHHESPLRQDDPRLPTPLRLKFGDEHLRRRWNDVVLAPNTPKHIVL